MSADPRPVLFVTNHVPPFRAGAFARLHAAEDVSFALIGGAVRHGGGAAAREPLSFPAAHVSQRAVFRLAASGRFRAVVAGLSGRLAPAAAWAGARWAGVPFVLWATMWAHPRTAAHRMSYLPVRELYRRADAIATYGPHVTEYVRRKGARSPVIEAPQSVDNPFWSAPAEARRLAPFQVLFVGRLEAEKGLEVLSQAWRLSGLADRGGALVAVGAGPLAPALRAAGATVAGRLEPAEVRDVYAGSDVVVVPSIRTPSFLEPWGLTVNEAFNRSLPVIATEAVGAAAGGLVAHEQTGLVVASGDAAQLAAALRRLHDDAALRARLGEAAFRAVQAYSHDAWSTGMAHALAAVGASRTVVA